MDDRLQLHHTRMQKGIDLGRICALTALPPMVVKKIDEGRFEELPAGIYARAYVRAFAEAIGLNAHHAMIELEPLLPAVQDPLPALRELTPPSALESVWAFVASQKLPAMSGLQLGTSFRTQVRELTASARVRVPGSAAPMLRRGAAALLDAVLLIAIGASMIGLAAWTCGVGVAVLLEQAGAELALMFSVPVTTYFVLLERIGGRTIGVKVCGSTGQPPGRVVIRLTRRPVATSSAAASAA